MNTPLLLTLFAVLFVFLCLLWPLARLHRRTGTWALIPPRRDQSAERVVSVSLASALLAVGGWVALTWWVEPEALGIWQTHPGLSGVGVGMAAAGLFLVAAAQAQMGSSWRIGIDDQPTDLVATGLFGRVRNPIYSGVLMTVIGLVLLTPSPWTISFLFLVLLIVSFQTRLEEKHLLELHGDRYRTYAQGVGRFVPGIGQL
jgi:protein-S-isoprenylcysteine O-methyltransferase Ste14